MDSHFDKVSNEWDTPYRCKRANLIAEEIIKRVPYPKTGNVLEFGCGTGLISFNLLNDTNSFTLVDPSKGMIDIVEAKIIDKELRNFTAVRGDLFSKDFLNKSYNFIYSSMVLHHLTDIEKTAKRFNELIEENGYLCVVDLNTVDKHFHSDQRFDGFDGFDLDWLSNIFTKNSFEINYAETFFTDTRKIEGKNVTYSLFILVMKKVNFSKTRKQIQYN